jgi:hypothetical protein
MGATNRPPAWRSRKTFRRRVPRVAAGLAEHRRWHRFPKERPWPATLRASSTPCASWRDWTRSRPPPSAVGITGGVGLLLLGPDGAERAGTPAPRPHRRTRLGPHRHPAMAAPGPGHQQRLRPADHGHTGAGHRPASRKGLTPELQFAVQRHARVEQARGVLMERERVDETAASTLLQQQAHIEGRPLRAIVERILARVRRPACAAAAQLAQADALGVA